MSVAVSASSIWFYFLQLSPVSQKMAETSQNLGDSENSSGPNPPITMKVDAPSEEDSMGNEVTDNERNDASATEEEEEVKVCSPSVRISLPPSSSTSSSNPFASSQLKQENKNILKPPQLSLNSSSAADTNKPASFILNPSRLNPFANASGEDGDASKKIAQLNGEPPKFVPLLHNESSANSTNLGANTKPTTAPVPVVNNNSANGATSTSSFVFGQNLQERVLTATESKAPEEPKPSTSLNSNGTSEMLFSSAIKKEARPDSAANNKDKESKTLSESAREYEELRANKRKYDEVEVITGEEGETNILNITCKLFAFDKTSGNWQERGRGVLRLNDIEGDQHTQSRLVFRTTGSLRVVLNTKIWAEMTVEQANAKCVRFTALDANGVIKVFLAKASLEDSKQLYSQVNSRVQKEVMAQKHKKINSENKDSGGK